MTFLKEEWRVVLLVLLNAALQLFISTRSLEFLIGYVLPDDAFYYFEIARNIATGHGSTFDGVEATNGYHPLWLLLLVPIFSFFSSSELLPIQVALLLSIAFNIGTAFALSRILARFSENATVRALGIFVFLFNPYVLYETLNGLETSISLFLFALFFLLALRIEEGKSRNYLLLGFVGGLMVLARLDLILYPAALALWVVLQRGWRNGLKKLLPSIIVGIVLLSPWFVWNVVNFKTLATSSSVASTIVNHELIVQDHGDSVGQKLKAVVYNTQYELDKLLERTGMYALACAFFGALLALVIVRIIPFPRTFALLTLAQFLFLGFVLLFFGNAGLRWTARSWYFISFNVFLAIVVVYVTDELLKKLEGRWKHLVVALLFAACAFSFYVNWSKVQRHGMPHQIEMEHASLWMNEDLPEGSVIGVFNAGIQGYVSAHRVVNLDGLVNNAALAALKKKDLWSYIESENIGYVADFPTYLTYRYKSYLPEDVLERLDEVHTVGSLSIYRLK